MSDKYVYLFSEGSADMRDLLGGKGSSVAEMTNLGLPVPEGFTISTEACLHYYDNNDTLAPEIQAEIFASLEKVEALCSKRFGDATNPLLVSVRSGARASMPGMMDTILNLGMNDEIAEFLAVSTSNRRWAYDSYRRLIMMYAELVTGCSHRIFEAIMDEFKFRRNVTSDADLTAEDMVDIAMRFKELYKTEAGEDFPSDPKVQLLTAVCAVFKCWYNPRAAVYRREHSISSQLGTAISVQRMVFGNAGNTSGTGVAFTRNPLTGENKLYGEFLVNAQGEDVVSGIRTPQNIDQLRELHPELYGKLVGVALSLERHFSDMQDIEFTVEDGKLFMLQTRNGKRSSEAALKIAVDLVAEGMATKEEALLKINAKHLDSLLHPMFEDGALDTATPLSVGLAASPGAACGAVYFSANDAKKASANGPVILVRYETNPEDIEGMIAAEGILTATGGTTSHAAIVARSMGTCCVTSCAKLRINEYKRFLTIGGVRVNEGEFLSLNGNTGDVYLGSIPTVKASISGDFSTIMSWADELRKLGIRANINLPEDAEDAALYGADGIGLTRTEHMFSTPVRLLAVQEMIISETAEQRRVALKKLLPMQRSDFEKMFRTMGDKPVTLRLLDPPLRKFLPTLDEEIAELAETMGVTFKHLKRYVKDLYEANPMMGNRGCRLAVNYPEIYEMQARAIIEAAIDVSSEGNFVVSPEIMIPLTCDGKELKFVKDVVVATIEKIIAERNYPIKYLVGTMIEIPRAALTADELARESDFFSFGTNDLTQMTYGFCRDDTMRLLPSYYDHKIFEADPFVRLDESGVGKLIEMAAAMGRQENPDIILGVSGEHGGDPESVELCHLMGLDYVSCTVYHLPIARLSAAHAAIKYKNK